MKKIILVTLAISMLVLGCEWRKFEFNPSLYFFETFEIDQTGAFSQNQTVTRSQVLSELDIPQTAEIEEVNIEKFDIQVIVKEGNVAKNVTLNGRLQLGTSSPELFNDFDVSLEGVNSIFGGLNTLIYLGIDNLKTKIKNYLEGKDTSPFVLEVYGDSGAERVNIDIMVKLTGSVKYKDCIEVLFFLEGGDPCSPPK